MHGTSTLQVDLDAIAHNVGQLRSLCAPSVRFCAVLKADAYGLGVQGVMPTLKQAGSSMFAVFSPSEACEMVDIDLPILVLMPVMGDQIPMKLVNQLQAERLHLVIHDAMQMKSIESLARRLKVSIPVHLKIDTGLHRGGCGPRDALIIARAITRSSELRLAGLMTHFSQAASSEYVTAAQMRQFEAVMENLSEFLSTDTIVHASGTCGALRGTAYQADMVRIGLAWSGHLPEMEDVEDRLPQPLKPAVSWKSSLVLCRTVGVGDRIGYGGEWVADRPTRLGLIPVGYADGYPIDAASPADGGPGLAIDIHLEDSMSHWHVPVIGRVSMDQVMVDLTDVPGSIQKGTSVELISSKPGSPCQLTNMAGRLGRPPHSILSQISTRVDRRYLRSADVVRPRGSENEMLDVSVSNVAAG